MRRERNLCVLLVCPSHDLVIVVLMIALLHDPVIVVLMIGPLHDPVILVLMIGPLHDPVMVVLRATTCTQVGPGGLFPHFCVYHCKYSS